MTAAVRVASLRPTFTARQQLEKEVRNHSRDPYGQWNFLCRQLSRDDWLILHNNTIT